MSNPPMSLHRYLTVLALLATSGSPPPDSWRAFDNQRVVSASGRRYVVIRKDGQGISYELCQRAAVAAPMTGATESQLAKGKEKGKIDRDPADRLVVAGKVGQLPVATLVPEALDGVLLFERYARIGGGKSVIYIDGTGTEKLSLTLQQIFGGVPAAATRTSDSIWWYSGYWIDEDKQSVVVVAKGDEVREITIADATITTPDVSRLLAWSAKGATSTRSLAMELLSRRTAEDLKAATPMASKTFDDVDEATAIRLRAAVILCRAGNPVAAGPLFAASIAAEQPEAVRRYAVRHLPVILGEAAMPMLRELMRVSSLTECAPAFAELGERAVPTLVAMLDEPGTTAAYRRVAANALALIKSPAALDALLVATAMAEDQVAGAACMAAIATGGPTLTARLIAILERGSTQDGCIAGFLQKHPTKQALPAIDAALARAKDETGRRWLRKARAACER